MQPMGDHSSEVQREHPTEARIGKYKPMAAMASISNSHLSQHFQRG